MRKLGSVCIGECSILCRLDEEAPSSEESGDTTWDMQWKRLPGGWEECPWHWLPTALSQGTTGKPYWLRGARVRVGRDSGTAAKGQVGVSSPTEERR